jgi:hypothetical protein
MKLVKRKTESQEDLIMAQKEQIDTQHQEAVKLNEEKVKYADKAIQVLILFYAERRVYYLVNSLSNLFTARQR